MNITEHRPLSSRLILKQDKRQIIIDKCFKDTDFRGKRDSQANNIFSKMRKEGTIIHHFDSPESFLRY